MRKKTYEHLLASLHGYLSFTHFLSSTCILLKDLPNLTLAALLIRPSNPIHVAAVEVWVKGDNNLQLLGCCKLLTAHKSFWIFVAFFTGRALNPYFPHLHLGGGGQGGQGWRCRVGTMGGGAAPCPRRQHVLSVFPFNTGLHWVVTWACVLLMGCLKCQAGRLSSLFSALLVVP